MSEIAACHLEQCIIFCNTINELQNVLKLVLDARTLARLVSKCPVDAQFWRKLFFFYEQTLKHILETHFANPG